MFPCIVEDRRYPFLKPRFEAIHTLLGSIEPVIIPSLLALYKIISHGNHEDANVWMSENAMAYLQKHDLTSFNPRMGVLFNNEAREKALEEQARLFSTGPMAHLMPADTEILYNLPSEAVSLPEAVHVGGA
jgi:hypothetical protein